MKISKRYLNRVIQEELVRVLREAKKGDWPPSKYGPGGQSPVQSQGTINPHPRYGRGGSAPGGGEVVDLFLGQEKTEQARARIARALAARAEEMLDIDDDSPNYVEVQVDPKLFLSPYLDVSGHGREVQPLADGIYQDIQDGDAEGMEEILTRISIDYFDEDIIDCLQALGDDRFGDTSTLSLDFPSSDDIAREKTKELASQQDPGEVERYGKGMNFEKYLKDIESGKVVELEQED